MTVHASGFLGGGGKWSMREPDCGYDDSRNDIAVPLNEFQNQNLIVFFEFDLSTNCLDVHLFTNNFQKDSLGHPFKLMKLSIFMLFSF